MNKEIIKYPNPILRQKSEEILEITPEIEKFTQEMIEVLKKNNGLGLAAPQVGESKRIIVVQTKKKPIIFINPKIIKKSEGQEIMKEGCLSFPGIWLKIQRSKKVEMIALNIKGQKVKIKARDILARVLQHEIDHLDGILFIDHVSLGRRIWELFKFYIIKILDKN